MPGLGEKATAPPVRPLVTAHIGLPIDKVLSSLSVGITALAPSSHLCCSHASLDRPSQVLGREHTEPFSEDPDAQGLGLVPQALRRLPWAPWQHWESWPRSRPAWALQHRGQA